VRLFIVEDHFRLLAFGGRGVCSATSLPPKENEDTAGRGVTSPGRSRAFDCIMQKWHHVRSLFRARRSLCPCSTELPMQISSSTPSSSVKFALLSAESEQITFSGRPIGPPNLPALNFTLSGRLPCRHAVGHESRRCRGRGSETAARCGSDLGSGAPCRSRRSVVYPRGPCDAESRRNCSRSRNWRRCIIRSLSKDCGGEKRHGRGAAGSGLRHSFPCTLSEALEPSALLTLTREWGLARYGFHASAMPTAPAEQPRCLAAPTRAS